MAFTNRRSTLISSNSGSRLIYDLASRPFAPLCGKSYDTAVVGASEGHSVTGVGEPSPITTEAFFTEDRPHSCRVQESVFEV